MGRATSAGPPPRVRYTAVFFSLIASAKRHDLDPFEYLRDLFDRLPAHPAKDRGDFLPDRWKALRQKRSAETPALAAAGD